MNRKSLLLLPVMLLAACGTSNESSLSVSDNTSISDSTEISPNIVIVDSTSQIIKIDFDLRLSFCMLEDNTYEVSGISGLALTQKQAVIPSSYEGISVTRIAENAFLGFVNLEHVSIPDSITSIGENAFEYCCSLKEICIPESVEKIDGPILIGCN